MRFSWNAFAAVAVVVLSAVGAFAQSENPVVDGIMSVTTASATLQVSVSELSVFNFLSKGTEIVSGLKNLTVSVTTFTKAITFMRPTSISLHLLPHVLTAAFADKPQPFDNDIAEEVVQVLTDFVAIHQALLRTIIGKQSLASKFFLTAPIAAALRAIETVVDAFASALISLIPTQSNSARAQFEALTETFSEAISVYS